MLAQITHARNDAENGRSHKSLSYFSLQQKLNVGRDGQRSINWDLKKNIGQSVWGIKIYDNWMYYWDVKILFLHA